MYIFTIFVNYILGRAISKARQQEAVEFQAFVEAA